MSLSFLICGEDKSHHPAGLTLQVRCTGLEVRGQRVPGSKAELQGPRRTHQVQPQGCPHSGGLKEGGPICFPTASTLRLTSLTAHSSPSSQGLQPGFRPPPSLTQELPQWLPAGLRAVTLPTRPPQSPEFKIPLTQQFH